MRTRIEVVKYKMTEYYTVSQSTCMYIQGSRGRRPHILLTHSQMVWTSGGSINRKLDCLARFGPSSDQSNLPSIARSLPSDNENKHDETAAILKDTSDRQDTL